MFITLLPLRLSSLLFILLGRATHQPTSNRGENIACRNTSIRGVSKTLPSVPKTKALSAPGREWGTALRADSSSTGSTKSESFCWLYFPF